MSETLSQEELATNVEAIAIHAKGNSRLGESYIIESNAALIRSNARVEKSVEDLTGVIKKFNTESGKQSLALVRLTVVLVIFPYYYS